MKKVLALALLSLATACTVGEGGDPTGGGGGGGGAGGGGGGGGGGGSDGSGGGGGGGTAGHITTDTTWSGTMPITAPVTIDPGVTVTVEAGTELDLAASASITVAGTLDASAGTKASPIKILPATAGGHFGSFSVQTGGMLIYSYVTQNGGGFNLAGTAMFTDSSMSQAEGDYMVMNGGSIDMEYSQIGLGLPTDTMPGTGDTTHCNFHINSAASVKVENSNIIGSPYGLMLYSTGADLKSNNFNACSNGCYDFEPGESGTGDVSGSYFRSGQITSGANGVTGTLSTTPLVAGPR